MYTWLVVWNMFYFSIYWEESSQLTNIFQRGWNHQPDTILHKVVYWRIARVAAHKRSCKQWEYPPEIMWEPQKYGNVFFIQMEMAWYSHDWISCQIKKGLFHGTVRWGYVISWRMTCSNYKVHSNWLAHELSGPVHLQKVACGAIFSRDSL